MKSFCITIAVAFSVSSPLFGANKLEAPNWDATLATQTANLPESQARLEALFVLVRSGDLAMLEHSLNSVIVGGSLSQPTRDSILFNFTVGLADLEHVDPKVIDRLREVKPMVFVSHEERATVGVPLFNIAGAAEGVFQHYQRLDAQADAKAAMSVSPDAWNDAYLLASGSQRRGFTDALETASDDALSGILQNALQRLPTSPELTPAAGKAALLVGDGLALQQVVRFGTGADLPRILEAASHTLSSADTLALLEYAIAEASPVNASLAIAQLYSPLAGMPEANDLLLAQLADTDVGAAAALALATSANAETLERLRHIAQQDDGLASARARIALDLGSARARQE